MNLEQRCTIPAPRAVLWDFLMNVPEMATCVPGVQSVTAAGDDRYDGQMRVRVGPINLSLQGTVTVEERDRENWRARMRADANDRRVGGGVHATANMTLIEQAEAMTELVLAAEARMLGKLGEFGQPVVRKLADATVAEFARNVAERLQSARPDSEPGETASRQSIRHTQAPDA